jgi:predicted O-methyltransferase YrrM
MDFLSPEIQHYAEAHSSPPDALLKELERETHLKVLMPRMLSGHLQGNMLAVFVQMLAPQRILEIGTYTGYSAICMASAMPEQSRLYTIDINEELAAMVARYIRKAGLGHKVQQLTGDATALIPTLQETFDLVFIDADKARYGIYYDLIFDKVRKGGFIIADNVLWSGKVASNAQDKDTLALDTFNKKVNNDPRVENTLFPLRDGLMIIRKITN